MAKDKEQQKPADSVWEKHGLSKEAYDEIKAEAKAEMMQELKGDIKSEILKELRAESQNQGVRVHPRATDIFSRVVKEGQDFKVALNTKVGMWSTSDQSIKLDVLQGNVVSEVINTKHPMIEEIKDGVNYGRLALVPVDTKNPELEVKNLSQTGEVESQRVTYPEEMAQMLNGTEQAVIDKLNKESSVPVLKALLDLERQAKNDAGRTRPNVISAINSRIRAVPLSGTLGGMKVDSEVTEEGPEEAPKPANNKQE